MNKFFNPSRFLKLLKKELSENTGIISKIAILSSLLMIAWLGIAFIQGSHQVSLQERQTYMIVAITIVAIISPIRLYSNTNNREKGIDYITLPASFNEKYLSLLVNCIIILPAITILSILATDLLISIVNPAIFPGCIIASPFQLYEIMSDNYSLSSIFAIQPLFILGNAVFRHHKGIKTLISIIAIYLCFAILVSVAFYCIYHSEISQIKELSPSNNYNIIIDSENFLFNEYFSDIEIFANIVRTISYGIPAAALAGAYFKMKKQQY